jgi:hypothetical protein
MSDANRCSPHNAIECPACEFDALRAEVARLKSAPDYAALLLSVATLNQEVEGLTAERDAALARVREFEADCAAMRGALESAAATAHWHNVAFCPRVPFAECPTCKRWRDALAANPGATLLERVERLEVFLGAFDEWQSKSELYAEDFWGGVLYARAALEWKP